MHFTGKQVCFFLQCNTISKGANWKRGRNILIISAHFWLPAQKLLFRNRLNRLKGSTCKQTSEMVVQWWVSAVYSSTRTLVRLFNLYNGCHPFWFDLKMHSVISSFFFALVVPCWAHITSQDQCFWSLSNAECIKSNINGDLLYKNHIYKAFKHSCVASVCKYSQPIIVKINYFFNFFFFLQLHYIKTVSRNTLILSLCTCHKRGKAPPIVNCSPALQLGEQSVKFKAAATKTAQFGSFKA